MSAGGRVGGGEGVYGLVMTWLYVPTIRNCSSEIENAISRELKSADVISSSCKIWHAEQMRLSKFTSE